MRHVTTAERLPGQVSVVASTEIALPVFDGLAAAHGRLYLTTYDGRLLCLGDRSTPGGVELQRLPEAASTSGGSPVEPGPQVRINAVSKRAGSILVAVTRRNGEYLPGRAFEDALPVVGDQHRTPVRWKSGADLGNKDHEPVCLRFRMDRAKLYSLDFE